MYTTKSPEIENVYLEANDVQSYTKGFRIIIRNTDMSPDIFYLDLYFDKEWFVKSFGIINTDNQNKQFICSRNINKSLKSFEGHFGKKMEIIPTMFISLYFNGYMDCRE